MDVSKPDAVSEAFTQFCADGRLRLLFDCASILCLGRFGEITPEDHARLLAINLQGILNCCHAASPFLRATSQARVPNMGSASGLYGIPEMVAYSASEFAIRGLTETLELEWRHHGVRVADLVPPFARVPTVAGQICRPPVLRCLGLRLNVEDIARVVRRQARNRRIHRPVGRLLMALYWVGQLFLLWVGRAVMARLSRDEQALAFIRRSPGVLADTVHGGIRPTSPGNADCCSSSVERVTACGYPPSIRDIGGQRPWRYPPYGLGLRDELVSQAHSVMVFLRQPRTPVRYAPGPCRRLQKGLVWEDETRSRSR